MSKVAPLLVGTAAATALIQCKAVKHGVFNSAADSRMIYVDPDNENADIHSPKLTREDAKLAFQRGLIKDPEDAKAVGEDEEEPERDPNLIGTVAAERTEQFAKEDDKGSDGSGTLDSRSSTAWEDRSRVEGGVEGTVSATDDIDQVSGDDDAAPAPRRTRKAS